MELISLVRAEARDAVDDVKSLVLRAHCNVNAVDGLGATALHYAAQTGQDDVLIFLIGKGADVRIQDKHGHTALHVAVLSNREATVRSLVEFSLVSDLLIKDRNDKTPLDLAQSSQILDILRSAR
eukprot:c1965_g1_i1.p1 GENE.c1965_g1_i1~~c1965_g1_i1.p1  ORF type:complete len:125 (+),score=7.08 c1965_g1_i1:61-435(+)